MQATALGSIGVSFIFVSGVPALIQLGLLDSETGRDYGVLVLLTFLAGFWGLAFTVPLRDLFTLKLARHLKLVFPMATASALTIRTLHSRAPDEDGNERRTGDTAKTNLKVLSISFVICFVWAIASSYAPGILFTWNPLWWIHEWGGHGVIAAISWGWFSWSWSPAILGIGAFIGLEPALSFLSGTVLAWGIIGPIIVHAGWASKGIPRSPDVPGLVTYNAFNPNDFITNPSPRYWILWPAVFTMLATSLTTVALEGKSFVKIAKYAVSVLRRRITGQTSAHQNYESYAVADPVPQKYRIKWWEWLGLGTVSFVTAMIAMPLHFGISADMSFFHLVLGFLWSVVVIQVYGAVGITPIGSVSKGSQFITGAVLRDQVDRIGADAAARSNLLGATISSGAAQAASELIQDFRTGFLLGTPTRDQWYAQLAGTCASTILSPAVFLLFTKAFPCITDAAATTCQFALPSVTSWRIITIGILAPEMPISTSSWVACIIFVVLGVAITVAKRSFAQHAKLGKFVVCLPNPSLMCLAMTMPETNTSLTITIGGVAAALWARYGKASHAKLFYAVVSGAVAGEGVSYVLMSVLQIANVGGSTYGTKLGCVANVC